MYTLLSSLFQNGDFTVAQHICWSLRNTETSVNMFTNDRSASAIKITRADNSVNVISPFLRNSREDLPLIYLVSVTWSDEVKKGRPSNPLPTHEPTLSRAWTSHGTLKSASGATSPTTEWPNPSRARAAWFALLYCPLLVSSLYAALFLFTQSNAQKVPSQKLLWLRTPRYAPISAGKIIYLVLFPKKKISKWALTVWEEITDTPEYVYLQDRKHDKTSEVFL